MTFRHILCPFDFSPSSREALEFAMLLARDFEARLDVLHVVPLQPDADGLPSRNGGSLFDRRRRLELAVEEISAALGFEGASVEALRGRPRERIGERVAETGADLLVMGTQGHSEFERLYLGSVTAAVLQKVKVPLLVVPRRTGPHRRGRLRTVLAAVEPLGETKSLAEVASSLAKKYGCRLLLVSASPSLRLLFGTDLPPSLLEVEIDAVERRRTEARRRRLNELLPALGVLDRLELAVEDGPPSQVLVAMAAARQADLLLLQTGQENEWAIGSTCQRVIRGAPCPVLLVRGE
jgi:nucleotide-binding universal stress UspA family protein